MGYYLKLFVGLVLVAAGSVAFEVGLVRLLELHVSSCASGNTPYAIAQPCPKGTGTDVVLLMGGILGGLIGAGFYANRGPRPGGELYEPPLGLSSSVAMWALLFAGTGLVCLYLRFLSGRHLSAGAELATIILAATFIPMGVAPLLWTFGGWRGDRKIARRVASNVDLAGAGTGARPRSGVFSSGAGAVRGFSPGPVSAAAGGDPISKLERLERLRKSGALTDSEFEREKARVLAEG